MQIYASTYRKAIAGHINYMPSYERYSFSRMDWAKTGEKLKLIREAKGLKQSQFSELIGVKQPNLSAYENNRVEPESRTIKDIINIAGVNLEWWNTGKGNILLGAEVYAPLSEAYTSEATPLSIVDETEVTRTVSGSEFRDLDNGMVLMTIPLVDEYAYASYPHGWKDSEYIEELPKHSIVLPKRDKGRYRAFVVRGDSMDDGGRKAIYAGDIVVGREVERDFWQSRLYINGTGRDYIIVHQDGVFIKRIIKHDVKEGLITCASSNPDKDHFPDFDVRLSEVYELYIIWKVERDWRH
ncbi:LexA family transcriptional regulator [Spirosoma sp.]|uniref:LexA family transcriptional regulator n=1 Tax=Spirosoma sp. TaxID=1899569 RepID=UPI003B3A2E99